MELKNTIKVTDKHGFIYEVEVTHTPHHGFSTARYRGSIIASRSYGRMLPPQTDDDAEWEEWQTHFYEWVDGPDALLGIDCKTYFDNQYPKDERRYFRRNF